MKKQFDMDAIEFIRYYPQYITELQQIVKSDLLPVLEEMKNCDPHDLVSPEVWFVSVHQARGYVFSLFLRKCQDKNNEE